MMRTGRIAIRGKRPGCLRPEIFIALNHFSIFRHHPVEYSYIIRKAATTHLPERKKACLENNHQGSFARNVVHIVLCIVTVFLIGHTGLLAAEPQPGGAGEKQVVVLYSQPRDFPATEMVEQGLLEGLAREKRLSVQLYSEYLDLSRFRDVPQRTALANLLQNRYGGGNIDLVICVDVPAALFLMENGEKLFSGIPVVMCSIPESLKDRILASSLKERVSGMLEPAALAQPSGGIGAPLQT